MTSQPPCLVPGATTRGTRIPCARILSLRSSTSVAGSPYSERLKRLVFRCLGSSKRELKNCGVAESVAVESLMGAGGMVGRPCPEDAGEQGSMSLAPLGRYGGSSRPIQLAKSRWLVEKGSAIALLISATAGQLPRQHAVIHQSKLPWL